MDRSVRKSVADLVGAWLLFILASPFKNVVIQAYIFHTKSFQFNRDMVVLAALF